MLEVGWSELLVIAMVLIIVVGPKDLPKMLRTFGTFMRKARTMASEFQGQFNEALKEAELDEVRKTIADVKGLNPRNAIRDALYPLRQAGEDVKRELNKADADIKAKAASNPATASPAAANPAVSAAADAAPAKPPVPVDLPATVSLPASAPAELAPVTVAPAQPVQVQPSAEALLANAPPKPRVPAAKAAKPAKTKKADA
jgi:sec-independent protein translocase protein TatB